ncbi:hypothetical protein RI367_008498 [Sorochytrium milnesiophthora]
MPDADSTEMAVDTGPEKGVDTQTPQTNTQADPNNTAASTRAAPLVASTDQWTVVTDRRRKIPRRNNDQHVAAEPSTSTPPTTQPNKVLGATTPVTLEVNPRIAVSHWLRATLPTELKVSKKALCYTVYNAMSLIGNVCRVTKAANDVYVCFETHDAMQAAKERGVQLDGHTLAFVECADPNVADADRAIKVVDLPQTTTKDVVQQHLLRFGQIETVSVDRNKRHCWAVVTFTTAAAAQSALAAGRAFVLGQPARFFRVDADIRAEDAGEQHRQLKLTGLPYGTSESELQQLRKLGATAWRLDRSASGQPRRTLLVTFPDSESLLTARQTRVCFRNKPAEWCMPNTKCCYSCSSPTHVARECPRRGKTTTRKSTEQSKARTSRISTATPAPWANFNAKDTKGTGATAQQASGVVPAKGVRHPSEDNFEGSSRQVCAPPPERTFPSSASTPSFSTQSSSLETLVQSIIAATMLRVLEQLLAPTNHAIAKLTQQIGAMQTAMAQMQRTVLAQAASPAVDAATATASQEQLSSVNPAGGTRSPAQPRSPLAALPMPIFGTAAPGSSHSFSFHAVPGQHQHGDPGRPVGGE